MCGLGQLLAPPRAVAPSPRVPLLIEESSGKNVFYVLGVLLGGFSRCCVRRIYTRRPKREASFSLKYSPLNLEANF